MATITQFLPLIFGAGSVVVAGSLAFPKLLGMDSEVLLRISGNALTTGGANNKEWIKLGGSESGEGIFVKTTSSYVRGKGGKYFGPARVGSSDSSKVSLAEEDKTIMIIAGSDGAVIFRGRRYFKNEKGDQAYQNAVKVNNQVWNTGESSLIVDEDKSYYCKGRTDQWKKWAGIGSNDKDIGYLKQTKAKGPLAILSLIDNKKAGQHKMETNCWGTEIFFPEKVSFLGKNPTKNNKERIEIVIKHSNSSIGGGYKFKLGDIEAVLYGRNKDLRITEDGIEDGIGNRIGWGKSFLPEGIKLVSA